MDLLQAFFLVDLTFSPDSGIMKPHAKDPFHIEVGEDELDTEIQRLAERMGEKPDKLRKALVKQDRIEAVRSEIAKGKALEFLVDHATVVDEEGNPVDLTLPGAGSADAGPSPDDEPTQDDPPQDEE